MKFDSICKHTFLSDLLGNSPQIIDCGANKGEFSTFISKKYQARIVGFEPDPRLYSMLPVLPNVNFFPNAVTGAEGSFELWLGKNQCSSGFFQESSYSDKVVVNSVKLESFCLENHIDKIDLLKLDIEGSEIDVLLNESQKFLERVSQITVEFHDFLNANQTPLITKVLQRMESLDFYYQRFSYHDYSDVLFINRRIKNVGFNEMLKINKYKYITGIKRMLSRKS